MRLKALKEEIGRNPLFLECVENVVLAYFPDQIGEGQFARFIHDLGRRVQPLLSEPYADILMTGLHITALEAWYTHGKRRNSGTLFVDDDSMCRQFLANYAGMCLTGPRMSPEAHRDLCSLAQMVVDVGSSYGNDLMPDKPAPEEFFAMCEHLPAMQVVAGVREERARPPRRPRRQWRSAPYTARHARKPHSRKPHSRRYSSRMHF